MLIIPAIDLKDGKCVRLRQGRADDSRVYSEDPIETARRWAGEGARYLHVVDLDGAFEGRPVHAAVIERIVASVEIPVEIGGGLRETAHVRAMLDAGVERAIIGTRAANSPDSIGSMAAEFGERLAVGIDARDGMVQVRGWVETTGIKAGELARMVDRMGVKTIICTDTATDGMLGGVNVGSIDRICGEVSCGVVASGGVHSPADVLALKNLGHANLEGVIVGKALYEGSTTLSSLMAEAKA